MTASTDEFRIADIPVRVRASIYEHVLGELDHEVGGVLVGMLDGRTGRSRVTGAIPALEAVGERASVTFTHEAWQLIFEQQEEEFPNTQIVGWYHSHPGFGIFLSEHDLFIHRNFFGDAHQFAYVVDPVERSEGVFGWRAGDVAMFEQGMLDDHGSASPGAPAAVSTATSHGKLTVDLADLGADPAEPVSTATQIRAGFAIENADLTDQALMESTRLHRRPAPGAPGMQRPVPIGARPPAERRRRNQMIAVGAGVAVLLIGGVGALALGGGGAGGGAGSVTETDGLTSIEGKRQLEALNRAEDSAEAAVAQAKDDTPVPTPTPKAVVRVTNTGGGGNPPVSNNSAGPPAASSSTGGGTAASGGSSSGGGASGGGSTGRGHAPGAAGVPGVPGVAP